MKLPLGRALHQPNATIRDVYFPDDCMVSLLSVAARRGLEVGLVGREGVVGVPLAFGARSPVRALVQGAGRATHTTGAHFRAELGRSPVLRRAVARQAYLSMACAMQLCACNNQHSIKSRLARWLLMTRDHLPEDDLPLTQQLLADMLGVQREGVTKAASALKRSGIISYSRGRIRIRDMKRLRAASCSCYGVIRRLASMPGGQGLPN